MTEHRPIRILAIDDNPYDVRLIREMLLDVSRFEFELHHAARLRDGIQAVSGPDAAAFDAILLDLSLPDCAGLETFLRIEREVPTLPIVILSGTADEMLTLEAVRLGAQDYLVKGHFDGPLLARSVCYAVERKRAERAVAERIEERKRLEREILETSDREQQRISQDLHDSVGQELTGLSFMARSLAKTLEAKSPAEAASAERLVAGIGRALAAVQAAIKGLAPVEVDANGLMVALRHLVANVAATFHVACSFECDDPVPVDDNHVATNLYRIAQEGLHNAVKHAQASQIVVSLRHVNHGLLLQIADNGQGLGVSPETPPGFGLQIMSYRARAIGGELEIISPNATAAENALAGTVVRCQVHSQGTPTEVAG